MREPNKRRRRQELNGLVKVLTTCRKKLLWMILSSEREPSLGPKDFLLENQVVFQTTGFGGGVVGLIATPVGHLTPLYCTLRYELDTACLERRYEPPGTKHGIRIVERPLYIRKTTARRKEGGNHGLHFP